MSIFTLRSLRCALAGVTLLFALCSAQTLTAQDTTTADVAVQQANSALSAASDSSLPPTSVMRATLTARHERLIELFRTHPEKARGLMLNAKTRAWLLKAEPSYAALVEQDVPLTGELSSAVADDFAHHTSTKQYSLHTWTGDRALSFASMRPDIDRLVHHKITVTGPSLPEIVATETLREASPAETQVKTTANAMVNVSPAVTAATPPFTGPGVPPGAATLVDSTFGNQTVAVLILNFAAGKVTLPAAFAQQSFWDLDWNGPATPNVNQYTKEVSYNQTSVSTDVYGPITVPGNYDCKTSDALATAAITAAIATGVDVSKYNHYVFVFPSATCYYGGLGTTGGQSATALIPHESTYIWIPISANLTASTSNVDFLWYAGSQHEFGHNLGMNHSNSLDFGAYSLGPLDFISVNPGTVTPSGHAPESASAPEVSFLANASAAAVVAPPSGSTKITAVNTEYGDNFAGMGDPQGPYNGQHRTKILGWIPASGNQDVTSSGSFTLSPAELSAGLRTLHVLRDPISSSWIWVEFHQPIGIYTPRSESHDPLDLNPNTLYNGAQLHYQNGFNDDGHTLLMDMTPVSQPNNFYDNNLAPGASWSDAFSLLTITAGTQSASSLGITVGYDTPCATVALSVPSISAAGGSGSVTLTAPSTCNWSVSSNASWISFSGATTGTGNGTVTFVASPNTGTSQRNSYLTAQRQSLSLVQEGTAITVAGVAPAATTVAPTSSVPLALTLVDAKGSADISQINFTIAGGTSPDCKFAAVNNGDTNDIDLYQSTNGNYSAAMTTGQPGTLSNSSCTVDVGKSTYLAKGKNATLTLSIAFPATFTGVHSITASGQGSFSSDTIPVGLVNVSSNASVTQTLTITPATASAPLSGDQGTTVPFTLTGTNTSFTAASVVAISGAGVTLKDLKVVDATTVTGSLKVAAKAAAGVRKVIVTTGSTVDQTTFTVNASSSITLSPAFGPKGAKVPLTITGIGTSFTADSTVTVSGDRVQANKVMYVSPTSITADFDLDKDAASDVRTVTVTSGAEVDTATFTISPEVIPTIVISPATGNQNDFAFVTIKGTNTHFTDATTTIKIPGTDIKITDISVADSTMLTAKFTMTSTATASAREVKITSGTEIVKGTFTVTAYAPTTTSIISRDAEIIETNGTILTITVAPAGGTGTPTGYVSFVEHKGGGGLEDILGTVSLSGGKASLPISNLSVGVHTFSAQYLGDNAAFAESKSTADAKVTVTADPGTVTLAETAALQRLDDGSYEAIVTIANSGTGTAKDVQMTSATLGGTAASPGSESRLPDIAPGASITSLSFFPASTGAPGTASVLKFAGTYKGGNFSGSARVSLP